MNRLLLLTAATLISTTIAAETVTFTFNRTGADVSSVTVISDNEAISAELTSIAPEDQQFKTSGTAIDSSVLCIDLKRIELSKSDYYAWTFAISGLPEMAKISSHQVLFNFVNADGIKQTKDDSGNRYMIPSICAGSTDEDLTEIVNLGSDNMYASGAYYADNNTKLQKDYSFDCDDDNPYSPESGNYILSVRLTRPEGDDGVGCYYGISQITVTYSLESDYVSEQLSDYLSGELIGIKNQSGLFVNDALSAIEDMDLSTYSTVAKGKEAIDEKIEALYATLDGKTYTIHNVFNSSSGTATNFYLSAKTGTHLKCVASVEDNNAEWTLKHLSSNIFAICNESSYIASAGAITSGSAAAGPDVTLETSPETPAYFALEPYTHEDYAQTNTVALRCVDMTDANEPTNGPRVYIQNPSNFTVDVESVDNTTCKYYSNPHATNGTADPAKKGAWVLTEIIPGSTSSITTITVSNEADNAIYDLSGRRLNKPVHGINIINGKKISIR